MNKKVKRFPDGRINYSDSNTAPVITVFLRCKNKILLLKRSDKVRTYQKKWNTVAGYLDDLKPIREKILEEIQEELGIKEDNILSIQIGKVYKFTDEKIDKTWIVHPALAELKNKQDIKLDSEHTEYKWINPRRLKDFDTVPRLNKSFENALK